MERTTTPQTATQMFTSLRKAGPDTEELSKAAEIFELTLVLLKERAGRRHKRFLGESEILTVEELELVANLSGCPPPTACPAESRSSKYRSISGLCNNRNNPHWGAANSALARWLPAEYEDAGSQPKGWNTGQLYTGYQLPPVREISNKIIQSSSKHFLEDDAYSQMLVDWGQYIDHDISFTPQSTSRAAYLEGLDCLKTCENVSPCFPIEIPPRDKLAGSRSCLPFFRSSPACLNGMTHIRRDGLTQPPQRQQMNVATSFIDASTVYGHNENVQNALRNLSSSEGLLAVNTKFSEDGGRSYLPFVPTIPSACLQDPTAREADRVECFTAGDSRVNEIVPLSALHTLWVREHNRIAKTLKRLNPHWSSEITYQETRKIIGALHQIITMRDYIPKIIGEQAFDQHIGPYEGYNDSVNPSVSNVFATAAFRFGHATISAKLQRLNESFQEHELYPSLNLHQTFFSPWRLVREGGLDPVLRGLLGQPAPMVTQEHLMSVELTERLVLLNVSGAFDLAALNLQRGRDHGLPGYTEWRAFCGLPRVETRAELSEVVSNEHLVEKIMDVYGHLNNTDVWLGGLVEDLLPGARTGPLFACLIGKQMKKLRDGDRFWWENPGVFSPRQRQELQRHSLSRVICDNSGVTEVPLDPFRTATYPDDFHLCDNIPSLNLEAWKDDLNQDNPCGFPIEMMNGDAVYCYKSDKLIVWDFLLLWLYINRLFLLLRIDTG
ncbi:thyroid peroxidase [Chanos chanos]|uniref:Thyroid peroxidase n=1 Tax=Chanos chanos TaxID=29144 RepID=A0A6J2UZV3_CHACN|nr:thyroid peroxidase [Chanos chanos]